MLYNMPDCLAMFGTLSVKRLQVGVDDGAMEHCGKLPEMVENFLFRVPRYGTGYRYLCGRILFILLRKESMNVETEKKLLLCQRMIMKI